MQKQTVSSLKRRHRNADTREPEEPLSLETEPDSKRALCQSVSAVSIACFRIQGALIHCISCTLLAHRPGNHRRSPEKPVHMDRFLVRLIQNAAIWRDHFPSASPNFHTGRLVWAFAAFSGFQVTCVVRCALVRSPSISDTKGKNHETRNHSHCRW